MPRPLSLLPLHTYNIRSSRDYMILFQLTSFALALLMVFRTNTAHARWWEVRGVAHVMCFAAGELLSACTAVYMAAVAACTHKHTHTHNRYNTQFNAPRPPAGSTQHIVNDAALLHPWAPSNTMAFRHNAFQLH